MFVHVAKKSTFTSELQEQYTNSIVFIKDSQEIYTHGTFYAIPDSYKGKITSLESAVAALQAGHALSKNVPRPSLKFLTVLMLQSLLLMTELLNSTKALM